MKQPGQNYHYTALERLWIGLGMVVFGLDSFPVADRPVPTVHEHDANKHIHCDTAPSRAAQRKRP